MTSSENEIRSAGMTGSPNQNIDIGIDTLQYLLEAKARSARLRITLWASIVTMLFGVAGAGVATSYYFSRVAERAANNAIAGSLSEYERVVKTQKSILDRSATQFLSSRASVKDFREELEAKLSAISDQFNRIEQQLAEPRVQMVRFQVPGLWSTLDDLSTALARAQRFCIDEGFETGLPSAPQTMTVPPALWCLR